MSDLLLNNIKNIPDENSQEYLSFWDNERDKLENGVTINGVYISGWLYWHTQLWHIYQNVLIEGTTLSRRKSLKSSFRDNEWMIAEYIEKAEREKKGLMLFGARRFGKSEMIASYLAHGATLFQGTENVVMGGNWGDIDIIMNKIDHGLNKLPSYFKFNRLANNLRKEIEFGYKDKKGNRDSWSKIICRNHDNGTNTESPAGLTPSRFVIDEVAKSKFSEVLDAAKPAFTSEHGWMCSPILTGTSGDISSVGDAQVYFENPESNNFIFMTLPDEGNRKTSIFISALYRMDGKVDTSVGNYIENEKGILLPKDSELFSIPMRVKDDNKALEIINDGREKAKLSPDPTALTKEKMYFPLNTKELFLTDDDNKYPKEAIQEHIEFLKSNSTEEYCELYRDLEGKVKMNFSTTKKPILEFPLEKSKFNEYKKDAPIIIYERPKDTNYIYVYISGLDSYNMNSSKWSESLGSIFIFKRFYDPLSGSYQRRIVAEYTARPENLKTFHENCEMLLELYNATCMIENEATTTIQYFDLINKSNLLADGFSLLKEIHPTTSITNRAKGLPATKPVQRHYHELIYEYVTEEVTLDYDKEGNPIKKLGLVRIPSIGLLLELLNYNSDGNFDRIVAFGHALTYEKWADKMYPIVETNKETTNSFNKETKQNTLFSVSKGIFTGRNKNPFL